MLTTGPKCVLVVDDDDMIRQAVGDILEMVGYRVETAADGKQALAKMGTTRPDAIVLDLMMPVMDGWEFMRACRSDPAWGGEPVMVMSAHPKLEETANELQVQGFLAKPFDLPVLLDTLERMLQTYAE